MKNIYLDNAATTPIRNEVVQVMSQVLSENYGNPSSSHSFGRSAKNLIESARKSIAKFLNASSQEIIFTSGGTEGNNFVLQSAVRDLKVTRIITSKIEHHAVLHTIQNLKNQYDFEIEYVNIFADGKVDVSHLVELLSNNKVTLVTLMHINNEIGTVLDIEYVSVICKEYKAFFHTDAVQSMGKICFDLEKNKIDFLVASGHKFHGPKGIGFVFIRKGIAIKPMIVGGEQEKGLRAGTESVHDIVGMAKALELSYLNLMRESEYILVLKKYCVEQLIFIFKNIKINGGDGFHTILNVLLPIEKEKAGLLLFNLDMKGIAVSRGSACQSGSSKPSHVLAEFLTKQDLLLPYLRISFSHLNTKSDIDALILVLKSI